MLNNCSFIGNLVADPQVRLTATEKKVASFTLAVNRNHPAKDGPWPCDFINFTAWNGMADKVAKYKKGSTLSVTGRLETSSYEDKDGKKRSRAVVNVNFIQEIKPRYKAAPENEGAEPVDAATPEAFDEVPSDTDDGDIPF